MYLKTGSILYIEEPHHNIKDRHHLKVKGLKNIFQANGPHKQTKVVILKLYKIDFIRRDKEGQHMLIKRKSTRRMLQFLTSKYTI